MTETLLMRFNGEAYMMGPTNDCIPNGAYFVDSKVQMIAGYQKVLLGGHSNVDKTILALIHWARHRNLTLVLTDVNECTLIATPCSTFESLRTSFDGQREYLEIHALLKKLQFPTVS